MRRESPSSLRLRYAVSLMAIVGLALSITGPPIARAAAKAPTVGSSAPNFSREDLSHKKLELSAFRGKVVLLNFWATWCAPCRIEMPQFVKWQKEFGGEGLQIIGVSMDDTEAPVRATSRKLQLNYPVVMGDAKLGRLYGGIFGLPVTFLIDREGKIRYKQQGAADLSTMKGEIQRLLKH